ncbi:Ankyrin repeat and SOCS box protein 7 [Aspergillus nanangensis]|uniref:Ankyrin repeat and SOCS box protein 7 n=1 Tax=Aspergillus nanangensis TaxID=2582783 RepID=A0AAD4CBX6_ASPNN|nr:Ankyrin repeat and SOCS box protein 7 [Aspergillus nanangensis]
MDGLSIAANVAGIASLAVQLAPHLYNYFADLKTAEQDVSAYRSEIQMLGEVCERLHHFLKTDAPEGDFDTTQSVLVRTIVSCEQCLQELARLLKSPGGWTRKMKWPVYKPRVEGVMDRLRRYTQLFQFSLTVEGCAILSQTPEDVTAVLKLQRDASTKLHEITRGIKALETSAESYRNTAAELTLMVESIRSVVDPTERLLEIQAGVGNDRDVEILDWLSSSQGHSRHDEVRARRTPGTGKWILDSPSFREWRDDASPRLLWFTGPPGSGKSTLLSMIVDELRLVQNSSNAAVAYYYCDYRSPDSDPLSAALGSILRALVESLDSVPDSLRDLYLGARREGRSPSPAELEALIRSASTSFRRCFILVDAMDEFGIDDATQAAKLTRILDQFVDFGIRVLVTSRTLPAPSSTARRVFEKYTPAEMDIRSYIAHALHSDETLVDLLDAALEATITDTVVDHAHGMFLLAVLHLQTISGQVTRSGVRRALTGLSSDLGDAYDKTFQAITHQSQSQRQLAMNTLMWVSVSHRPLNSLELQHALAVHDDDLDLDLDNIPPMKVVVRACCGLLAVDDVDDERSAVRLVHHTLHQYLQNRQPEWFVQAHTRITSTCLAYLCFKSLSLSPDNGHWPLAPFALSSWGIHASHAPADTYTHRAQQLLSDQPRLTLLYPDNPKTTGLHIAASFGLTSTITSLLAAGHKPDAIDSHYGTPLERACAHNHLSAAMLLLHAHANPDQWTLSCLTPLFHAVKNGNHRLASALLGHGATVDHWCADAWTALHKAADAGDLEMVQILLRHGASVTKRSARGLTAVHRAAGRGHLDVLELLLQQPGGKVDSKTTDGWTPLDGASASGQTAAVRLLLRLGADVRRASRDGDTPLHRACRSGEVETVRLLVRSGAEVVVANREGDLPLHIAAREGHGAVVECLLEQERAAQLGHLNRDGWTAFHEAQLSGSHATERLLMGGGGGGVDGIVTATPTTPTTTTPPPPPPATLLTQAITSPSPTTLATLQTLLTTQPHPPELDLESPDPLGRTPLHQALHNSSYKVAHALLSAGANIHAPSTLGGWLPIHYAAISGSADAVRLCLEYGARGDSRTHRGQTPLHHACRVGDVETVEVLLDLETETETETQDWPRYAYHLQQESMQKKSNIRVTLFGLLSENSY